MNSADYVDQLITDLKAQGNVLSDVAWKAALACVEWAYVFGARGQYCTPANRRARYSDKYPTIKSKCKNFDGSGTCVGCKWYPNAKRTRFFDCRGFTYWILLQVYGWKLMGAGATSQWNDDNNWKAKGKIADGMPKDTLVCLFYPDKTNPKKMAHTGFGFNDETVECGNNVQYSKTRNKKWTHWAIPACVDGSAPEPTPTPPSPEPEPGKTHPTLRKGSKGPDVVEMQLKLMAHGEVLPRYGADGSFGNETLVAVKSFQKKNNLVVDGICGPKTWAKLDA